MKRSKTQLLRSLAAVMLLSAGLASCSQDDFADNRQGEPLPPGEYPLELTAGGIEAVATPAQKSAPSTRGTVDGNWTGTEGKPVAVQVLDQSGNVISTNEYKVKDVDGETAKLHSDNPYYWQNSSEEITVNALYPRTTMPSNKERFDLPEVCTEETLKNSDFLWATQSIKFGQPANLEFRHLMTKFVINLRSSSYLEAAKREGKEIKAGFRMLLNGMFYINDNTCSIGPPDSYYHTNHFAFPTEANKGVNFEEGAIEDAFASYTTITVPGEQYIDVWVLVGETEFRYETSGWTLYSAGHTYTFNITVKESGLQVNMDESIGWGDDGAVGSGGITTIPDEVIKLKNQTDPVTINDDRTYLITGSGRQNVTISGSPTVILSDANIECEKGKEVVPISVESGNPVFILEGENTLTSPPDYRTRAALYNASGTTITIQGDGKLIVKGGDRAAAIGAGWQRASGYSCGQIIIKLGKDGIIEAISQVGGAAIGCGMYGNCEGIKILGGTVIARTGGGYTNETIATIGTAYDSICESIKLSNCTIHSYPSKGHSVLRATTVTPSYDDIDALKAAGVTIYVNDELYTK